MIKRAWKMATRAKHPVSSAVFKPKGGNSFQGSGFFHATTRRLLKRFLGFFACALFAVNAGASVVTSGAVGNTVKKIVAGTNITLSPTSGTGNVTINASAGGSSYDTTQSTTAIAVSTGVLSVSTASLYGFINSTGSALTIETNNRISADFSIGASTMAIATSTGVLSISTASIYLALNSTGSALSLETARATAAEALKINTSAIDSSVQAYDADLDDLADGTLTVSKVATGYPAANIGTGVLPATVRATPDSVDLSTVTTALSGKQASFTGSNISLCAADQYISAAATVNGVITSGSCRTDATGAGGSEGNTFTTSSKTFAQTSGTTALYISSGDIVANNLSTATIFNINVSSSIGLLVPISPTVASSGVVTYWMINSSTRVILLGDCVQSSSGAVISPQSVIGTIALATTTIMGVATEPIAIGAWGKIAVMGIVQVKCGVTAACLKGRKIIAAGGTAALIGRCTGIAAPAAGSTIGVWLESTLINNNGWGMLLN